MRAPCTSRARLSGVVLNSPAQAGQRVAAGDVLFEIDSHDVAEAKTDLLKKAAALDLATKTAEREALLFEKKISAEMEVQEARSRQAEARIELEGATSRLTRLGVAPAGAPGSGRRRGRRAERQGRGARFARRDGARRARQPRGVRRSRQGTLRRQRPLRGLGLGRSQGRRPRGRERRREGGRAMVEGPAGIVARGSVDVVSGTVSEQTRTARARIVVAQPAGALRPGMFVTVRIAGPSAPAPRSPSRRSRSSPTRGAPSSSSTARGTTGCAAR